MEWAAHFGKPYIRALVLISTAASQTPWAVGWAVSQRACIESDARWRGGFYGDDPPLDGLAAARATTMLSYKTHSAFEKRFGTGSTGARRVSALPVKNDQRATGAIGQPSKPIMLPVQSYLSYKGEQFNRRFDANCYVAILDKIDSHDISRGRSASPCLQTAMNEVLGSMTQRALIIGVTSDGLYPIQEQFALCEHMPNARFASIESDDGHDGFLIEGEQMNGLLQDFLR
jgi:homoserine O-acetyltransferase